jgi:hypothetical protein
VLYRARVAGSRHAALGEEAIDLHSGKLFECGHEKRCHSIRDDTDYRSERRPVQNTPSDLSRPRVIAMSPIVAYTFLWGQFNESRRTLWIRWCK